MRVSCKHILAFSSALLLTLAAFADGGIDLSNNSQPSAYNKDFYLRANLNFPFRSRFYGGVSKYDTKFKIGGQIAAGMKIHKNASIEIEGNYFRTPVVRTYPAVSPGDYRKIASWVGLVNIVGHLDLHDTSFRPFIGAGVGYVKNVIGTQINNSQNSVAPKKSTGGLAYQVFVGVERIINKRLSMILDVRHINLHSAFLPLTPTGLGISKKLETQTVTLGIKYKF